MRWSSFVDSCCTCCLVDSLRSGTSGFWPTATDAKRSPSAAHFSAKPVSSTQRQTCNYLLRNESARHAKSGSCVSSRESRLQLPPTDHCHLPTSTPHENRSIATLIRIRFCVTPMPNLWLPARPNHRSCSLQTLGLQKPANYPASSGVFSSILSDLPSHTFSRPARFNPLVNRSATSFITSYRECSGHQPSTATAHSCAGALPIKPEAISVVSFRIRSAQAPG